MLPVLTIIYDIIDIFLNLFFQVNDLEVELFDSDISVRKVGPSSVLEVPGGMRVQMTAGDVWVTLPSKYMGKVSGISQVQDICDELLPVTNGVIKGFCSIE